MQPGNKSRLRARLPRARLATGAAVVYTGWTIQPGPAMRADQSSEDLLREELTSIIARARRPADAHGREELFVALSRLEKQALIGGGSDETLKRIAEVRFLAGILRDSVRPARIAGPRALRRTVRGRPLRATREPADGDA